MRYGSMTYERRTMNTLATDPVMTDERKSTTFQIKCEPSWLDWVKVASDELGISAASYIRMVVTQRLKADAVPQPKKKPRNPPPR